MVDTRRKNLDWIVTNSANDSAVGSWDQVQLAVLMDIRDELQILNGVLRCPNFIGIPHRLTEIREAVHQVRRNTARKKKRLVVGKPKLRVVR